MNDGFKYLLTRINKQLEFHHILVKTEVKTDAFLTRSLRKPRGKPNYQIAEDRKKDGLGKSELEQQNTHINLIKVCQKGVD